MNKMIIRHNLLLGVLILCSLLSCKKYLDIKPNKKMVLPATVADCQALLDNFIVMNTGYPAQAEAFADNYYLTFASWNSQSNLNSDGYIWKADADVSSGDWALTYQKVLYANQALETLGNITPAADEKAAWNKAEGMALFFRALSYYQAVQIWGQPYNPATAGTDLGMPLRLTPDLSEKTVRASVQQNYDRIVQDLQQSIKLMPATQPTSIISKTQPGLAAAYGLLARVYLVMGDYPDALKQADLCLQNYGTLIDYNSIPLGSPAPSFSHDNAEVIFDAYAISIPIRPTTAIVDSALYASYGNTGDDLRQAVLYKNNAGTNTYSFNGSYEGSPYIIFCGIATDEVYLIRSECYARTGNTDAAMTDLNTLLSNRFKAPYTDKTAANADDALTQILAERRKELPFRTLRWTDLRRLNQDPRFAVTLTRNLNGTIYTLPPNDLRYTLLIPQAVLNLEPMAQNPR